jgi:hypothetical protein
MGHGCQDKLGLPWDNGFSYSCRERGSISGYLQVLGIIHHSEPLPPDLKSEYVMEEETHSLWVALKGRYEQQKAILLPEANHEYTQIHLQDFKSIEDYNHVIHKVCTKLRFCDKEPSEEDKIKMILQTMLPSDRVLQHQYLAQNYQHYVDLIRDLLQAEKHDEFTIKNHHQHRVMAAPLLEIHHNEKKASAYKDSNLKKNSRSAKCPAISRRTENYQR